MLRLLIVRFCLLLLISLHFFAFAEARILFQNEFISTQENNTFTIDAEGDVGSNDLILEFGQLTGTQIVWDITNDQFLFTDDVLINGNMSQTGRRTVLNQGSAGNLDEDVDIVAEQGSEADGVLRYDDGLNAWTLSNDNVSFNEIITSGSLFSGAGSIGVVPDPITETGKFLSDDGTWQNLLTARKIGFFQVNGNTTGSVNVTGVGFQPNFVAVSLNNDIEAQNFDSVSPINTSSQQGSFGWGLGYAYDDGASIMQHSQFISGSSNSINAHRSRSSNTQVIAVVTSNQNGNVTGRLEGTLSSFNTDGFTINITTNTLIDNYVFMYEAQVASGTEIQFISNSTPYETFTIDNDNTGGNLSLNFGSVLQESLRWNNSSNQFELSDDLDLLGGELRGVILENAASNPGACNTGNQGQIYYNSVVDDVLVCNETTWVPLANSSPPAVVQARRSTAYTPPSAGTWYDIPLDTIDVQNASAVLERNPVSTDDISVKKTGLYKVTYRINHNVSSNTHRLDSRLRINDATIVPGSITTSSNYQNEYSPATAIVYVELTAGDKITLQALRSTTNTIIADVLLTAEEL